ncbi:MAG: sigma-70 family RNA polymerase sigma factor [Acidimicrobiales bacterium]|nr:sigma-70 family RNA polymerase sigma factor [Acidimicrobiales bacterium]
MSHEPDDRDLVTAAQAGDRGALDLLLRRHHDRVYAVCRRLAGNDADANDATQEALIAIVRGLPRFTGRSSFGTWAYRVATNACLDELRRRGRRPTPGLPEVERSRDDGPGLATSVADRLDIDAALGQLPEEFRAPVILRDQLGMDYADIAATLDLAPGTVRSRIARGRARLVSLLGNQTTDDERQSPENRHGHL